MDFNTLVFLGFFAGVAVLTYCVPHAAKPYLWLLTSYAFYLYKPENARLVFILISVTVVTWVCALAMDSVPQQATRRLFLVVSLAVCCGFLFFFKYFNFFGELLGGIMGLFGGKRPIWI